MKQARSSIIRNLHRAIRTLLATGMIIIATGCGATPAVQLQGSGWQAQRYGLFNTVQASTNSSLPNEMQILDNTWKNVLNGGYVTTDASGQGKIIKGACTAYIFQNSSTSVKQETYSPCPRNTVCTSMLTNCSGISAVTLPASITFKGTVITIIVDNSMETVTVLSSEGIAIVTPSDPGSPSFEVAPGQGAYAVTPAMRGKAEAFFGFAPGEKRDLPAFVIPIQNLGQMQQVQSANLISIQKGLPIIPLPTPYTLVFQWLNEKYDDLRVSQAIVQSVDLAPILEKQFGGIPIFFFTQGQRIDLRSLGYNPDLANQQLAEAGIPQGREMVLAFDESIPGTRDLAAFIMDGSKQSGWINFRIQGVNPYMNENALNELDASAGVPVLFIGGG